MGRAFLPKLVSVASAAVRPSAHHIKERRIFFFNKTNHHISRPAEELV